MTRHIPTADEVTTVEQALAAAREHRRAAAAVARGEAAARGDLPPHPNRFRMPAEQAVMYRGAAPQTASAKRTWSIHHGAADSLVERANTLTKEQKMNQQQNDHIEALTSRIHQLEEQARTDTAARDAYRASGLPRATAEVTVGSSERTYRPDDLQRGHNSYVQDLIQYQIGRDPAAGARLERHAQEMAVDGRASARAVGVSAVGAFVPPEYAVDLFAPYARAGRPAANLCTTAPLPAQGMTVSIPRVTTGTSAAVQASEGTSVSETDMDETTLTVNVRTVAGAQTVSFQALARGEYVETVLWSDLGKAYAAALDTQIINGSGDNGQHLGLLNVSGTNAVTFTSSSPTLVELWPKLASAVGSVVSTSYRGPTGILVKPSIWAWMLSELDTSDRPLIAPSASGPSNSMGSSGVPTYGEVGRVMGTPVYLDDNIPANLGTGTNETRIIVAAWDEHVLMEDGPFQLRADEPSAKNLQSQLVLYGFSAFAGGRVPAATSIIAGTGMIPVTL